MLAVILLTASVAQAQSPDRQTAQIHRGQFKILMGTAIAAAGTVVSLSAPHDSRSGGTGPTGPLLIVGGFSLVLVGVHQQHKAVQPQTTFGLSVGRQRGVQVRRSW